MEKSKSLPNITNFYDKEIYIEDENYEQIDNIDENSLKSMSWIESVENELNVNQKQFSFIDKKKEKNNDDINYLINENYNSLSDINIIEYQTIIINYIKKNIKN